jgi:hypothetical protein
MKLQLIGDVHGKITTLESVLVPKADQIIQLGDLGVGFVVLPSLPDNFSFLRGNHDDPTLCNTLSTYLGHFGFHRSVFWVSGARSIDQQYRTPGRNWWPEEELSDSDFEDALKLYEAVKPSVMLSHECPQVVAERFFGIAQGDTNRTRQWLQTFFDTWKPTYWAFGHWHKSKLGVFDGTTFQCLAELESQLLEL